MYTFTMEISKTLKILGLSNKEEKVLLAIISGIKTPLLISKETKVTRPAVYDILKKLKFRGIVKSHIINGKKIWQLCNKDDIENGFYEAKKILLSLSHESKEVEGLGGSTIIIHRGKENIKTLLKTIFLDNKNKRLYGFQGNMSTIGWDKIFTTEETSEINQIIKKNGIIVEAVLPIGWFEEQTKTLGIEWAKDFEGRSSRFHIIEPEYFTHGGQMFILKDSLYLFGLNEEIIVEIRHSEIQKMILMFFRFMQDNSQLVDGNSLIRKITGIKD